MPMTTKQDTESGLEDSISKIKLKDEETFPKDGNPDTSTKINAWMKYYIAGDWEQYKEKENTSFCEDCQLTFPDWGRRKREDGFDSYEYWTYIGRIKQASADGCPFCDILMLAISYKTKEGKDFDPRVGVFLELRGDKWAVFFMTGEHWEWRLAMDFIPGKELDPENLPELKMKGFSTRGGHAMDKARGWLSNCKGSHEDCKEEVERSLPARLLHYRDGKLRVVLTDELDVRTRYAALSHCWGKIKILRLLKENVDTFFSDIPITELSRTFQDSLQVLTELGLEYIWIDSLCIIQDDAQDWEREAVKMSAVYGCAEVTIAASSSEDGSKGLFYERQLPLPRLCQLHIESTGAIQTFDVVPFQHWNVALSKLILSQRGWCYQERRLSPRVLFFTSTHLAWQCRSWGGEEFRTEGFDKISSFFLRQKTPDSEGYWDEAVSEYSAAKLTFWSDRLIAISGVARRRQSTAGGEYVAGMWKEDLVRELCWLSLGSQEPPSDYMAPSWSWASTAHAVIPAPRYKGIEDQLVAKVAGVDIVLAGVDPLGAVRSGVLKIECKGIFTGILGSRHPTLVKFGNCLMRRLTFFEYGELKEDRYKKLRSEKAPFYYLPLRKDDSGGFEGLVIKATNRRIGEYVRIGSFKAASQKKGGKKIDVKGDVDVLAWKNFQVSEADRQLLFVSSEGPTGPHLLHII